MFGLTRTERQPRPTMTRRVVASDKYQSRIHASGSASNVAMRLLIERNGSRMIACGRCGRPVDTGLSSRNPMGPTVGHIVAVAAGGTDALSNLRIEHWRCNARANQPEAMRARIARPIERD